MTHFPVRWTRVFLGVALTVLAALSPIAFVIVSGSSDESQASGALVEVNALDLAASGVGTPTYVVVGIVLVAVVLSGVLAMVVYFARSQSTES